MSIEPDSLFQPENLELLKIIELLHSFGDGDFREYKKNTLLRRTERRMSLRGLSTYSEFIALLSENENERKLLARDLLIGVTFFFREDKVWQILQDELLPQKALTSHPDNPFRIWIAGCSTGEEPYSIAIILHEFFLENNLPYAAQIFATDVDEQAVASARMGVFPLSIEKEVSEKRLQQFFTKTENGYRVSKVIREKITFAVQNLIEDPPFSNLDLISCRNLLIYLNQSVQKKTVQMFHFSLKPGGYLILGSSETIGNYENLFETLYKDLRIYKSIGTKNINSIRLPIYHQHEKTKDALRGTHLIQQQKSIENIMHTHLLRTFAPSSALVNKRSEILQFFGDTSPFLNLPKNEPTFNIIHMAKDFLRNKMRGAIQKAFSSNAPSIIDGILDDKNENLITLSVLPMLEEDNKCNFCIVCFQLSSKAIESSPHESPLKETDVSLLEQLENELCATRDNLQETIEELETSNEELKASNEEVMSMNEELQSSNEELETSKEELQSLNEELNCVNGQLLDKVKELETTNNDLINLMNSTEVATIFLDNALSIRRYTPSAKELFNLIETDIGRPLVHLTQKFYDTNLIEDSQNVIKTANTLTSVVSTPTGNWYTRQILPFRKISGEVEGAILTFNKITDIIKGEMRFKKVSSITTDFCYSMIRNESGKFEIEWAFGAFEKITGYKDKDLFESDPLILLPPDEIQTARARFEKILTGTSDTSEYKIITRTGEIKWIRVTVEPEWDNHLKQVTRLVASAKEITQAKRTEAELQKVQKLESIGILAGGIAHDFNNLLAGIYGHLEIALDLSANSQEKSHLTEAISTIERATSLTHQLLTFSKGGQPIKKMGTLNTFLQNNVLFVLSGSKITPHFDIEPNLHHCEFDINQIGQVIDNIVINAKQAMSDGGELTVVAKNITNPHLTPPLPAGNYVKVSFQDTGHGIPEESLSRIFDPFFTTKEFGSGLGLSTAYSIITKHGGRLEVTSKREKGSCFTFYLPTTDKIVTSNDPPQLKNVHFEKKALIMDDETVILEVTTRIFQTLGINAIGVRNGDAALIEIQKSMEQNSPFDLVILDLTIPGSKGGEEIMNEIRKISPSTLGVVSSGYSESPILLEPEKFGFVDKLSKPFRKNDLAILLKKLF